MDVRGVISKISRNKRRVLLDLFILCFVGAYFDCIFFILSNDYPRLNCVKEWRVADDEILEKYEYELRSYKYRNEEDVWVEIENQ